MEQNKNLTEENKGTLGDIKVTLKQLIEKKLEKDGKKTATKDIYIKSLDGCITFNNPSDSARIEYAEKQRNGSLC